MRRVKRWSFQPWKHLDMSSSTCYDLECLRAFTPLNYMNCHFYIHTTYVYMMISVERMDLISFLTQAKKIKLCSDRRKRGFRNSNGSSSRFFRASRKVR